MLELFPHMVATMIPTKHVCCFSACSYAQISMAAAKNYHLFHEAAANSSMTAVHTIRSIPVAAAIVYESAAQTSVPLYVLLGPWPYQQAAAWFLPCLYHQAAAWFLPCLRDRGSYVRK